MKSLLLYELVLLIAGAILFLALVFMLVYSLMNNKPIKNVFWFFIFPVIMMGFPALQSFTFDKGKIEIKKLTAEVKNDPENEEKRAELEKAIETINPIRIEKDAEASATIAEAQLELGNIPESEKAIQNSLDLEKNNTKAIALNNTIKKVKNKEIQYKANVKELNEIIKKVDEKNSATPKEIEEIKEILTKTEVPKYTSEKSQIVIAKGLNRIGDNASSAKILDNVLTNNPNSQEAIAVKKDTIIDPNVSRVKFNANKFERAILKKD
jgi:tetratricopeptide (TPR) repeat protein